MIQLISTLAPVEYYFFSFQNFFSFCLEAIIMCFHLLSFFLITSHWISALLSVFTCEISCFTSCFYLLQSRTCPFWLVNGCHTGIILHQYYRDPLILTHSCIHIFFLLAFLLFWGEWWSTDFSNFLKKSMEINTGTRVDK
jgi:hypothetical protein